MQLTPQAHKAYDERGYLFFPSLFSSDEMAPVRRALDVLLETAQGPEVYRESDAKTMRLMYDVVRHAPQFESMLRDPRLLGCAEQLLGEKTYLHQSRLNPKFGFSGGAWPWHQDYGAWAREDGMPTPRCIMATIFLDDVSAANGPLLVVPGSQRQGLIDANLQEGKKGDFLVMEIDQPTLGRIAADGGIDALIGPAGSVALVQGNLVHASAPNLTPWRRAIAYFMYNAVSNATTQRKRASYLCNPDFTPLNYADAV